MSSQAQAIPPSLLKAARLAITALAWAGDRHPEVNTAYEALDAAIRAEQERIDAGIPFAALVSVINAKIEDAARMIDYAGGGRDGATAATVTECAEKVRKLKLQFQPKTAGAQTFLFPPLPRAIHSYQASSDSEFASSWKSAFTEEQMYEFARATAELALAGLALAPPPTDDSNPGRGRLVLVDDNYIEHAGAIQALINICTAIKDYEKACDMPGDDPTATWKTVLSSVDEAISIITKSHTRLSLG